MQKDELARGLIQLWGEYTASQGLRVFQPTMTDFIVFLKQYEQKVKGTRTDPDLMADPSVKYNSVTQVWESAVNSDNENEARVTPAPLCDADRMAIERLHSVDGWSAPRIKHELGLKCSLMTVYNVINEYKAKKTNGRK